MDAMAAQTFDAHRGSDAQTSPTREAIRWAQVFHFLELALSHPGEDGLLYFRSQRAESELQAALCGLSGGAAQAGVAASAAAFFAGLRSRSFDEVEAEHIALFSANFPTVPCPPYGSLFTAEESKRLEEMLEIKQFYHRSGVDISASFDDLPDHICVELEFLQLLCFRLEDALRAEDTGMVAGLRNTMTIFLDRFMLPFVRRLTAISGRMAPSNPYSHLLAVTRDVLESHRRHLAGETASASLRKESLS